jgi:ElaB/YqjD/DUF883 family membrane-anchored ribosome-binding protein
LAKTEKKKAGPTLKDRTEAMKAGLKKTPNELKAGMEESVDKSRRSIQKRPLTAVAVAAGAAAAAGVVAGAVIAQKRKGTKKKEH